jgi:hypothetical protein
LPDIAQHCWILPLFVRLFSVLFACRFSSSQPERMWRPKLIHFKSWEKARRCSSVSREITSTNTCRIFLLRLCDWRTSKVWTESEDHCVFCSSLVFKIITSSSLLIYIRQPFRFKELDKAKNSQIYRVVTVIVRFFRMYSKIFFLLLGLKAAPAKPALERSAIKVSWNSSCSFSFFLNWVIRAFYHRQINLLGEGVPSRVILKKEEPRKSNQSKAYGTRQVGSSFEARVPSQQPWSLPTADTKMSNGGSRLDISKSQAALIQGAPSTCLRQANGVAFKSEDIKKGPLLAQAPNGICQGDEIIDLTNLGRPVAPTWFCQ